MQRRDGDIGPDHNLCQAHFRHNDTRLLASHQLHEVVGYEPSAELFGRLCCKNKRAVISSASLREKAGASFMSNHSQNPFKWRHFQADIMLLCVRWYVRYALSCRDLEEMMLERGLSVDHTTIYRWVQRYVPELEKRIRPHLKPCNDSRTRG
jgi:hypothetical protein